MIISRPAVAQSCVSSSSPKLNTFQPSRALRRRQKRFGGPPGNTLYTALFDARTSFGENSYAVVIGNAVRAMQARGAITCFVCHAIVPTADIGAYLAAINPRRAKTVALTALCRSCWTDRDILDIDQAAERVLQQTITHGRFIDPLPNSSASDARVGS